MHRQSNTNFEALTISGSSFSPDFTLLRRMSGLIRPIDIQMRTNSARQVVVFTDDVAQTAAQIETSLLSLGRVGQRELSVMEQVGVALSLGVEEAVNAGMTVDLQGKEHVSKDQEWKKADDGPDLAQAHGERFEDSTIENVLRVKLGEERFSELAKHCYDDGLFPGLYEQVNSAQRDVRIFSEHELSSTLMKNLAVNPQQFAFVAEVSAAMFAADPQFVQTLAHAFFKERRYFIDRSKIYLTSIPKGVYVLPIEHFDTLNQEYRNLNIVNYDRVQSYIHLQKPYHQWLDNLDTHFSEMNAAALKYYGEGSFPRGSSYAQYIIKPQIDFQLERFAGIIRHRLETGAPLEDAVKFYGLSDEEFAYLKDFQLVE